MQKINKDNDDTYLSILERLDINFCTEIEIVRYVLSLFVEPNEIFKLTNNLLNKYGDFDKICSAEVSDLKSAGLNNFVARNLVMIGKIIKRKKFKNMYRIKSINELYKYLYSRIDFSDKEQIHTLYLSREGDIIKYLSFKNGRFDSVSLDVSDLLNKFPLEEFDFLVISHNHPNGDPTPSLFDMENHGRLLQACQLLRIELKDHIIIGKDCVYSMLFNRKIESSEFLK